LPSHTSQRSNQSVSGALTNNAGNGGLVIDDGGSLKTEGTVSGGATVSRTLPGPAWHLMAAPVTRCSSEKKQYRIGPAGLNFLYLCHP